MENESELKDTIDMLELRLERACHQVALLDDRLRGLQTRYERACADDKGARRYMLQAEIYTVDGVWHMYREYVFRCAVTIQRLVDCVPETA